MREFQSTRPVRGGTTSTVRPGKPFSVISIHPPRAGRDEKPLYALKLLFDFNPPAPCGAGLYVAYFWRCFKYFNPPAPCGAGHNPSCLLFIGEGISIHPPRAGRDNKIRSIRINLIFQSTRPVRGGTGNQRGNIQPPEDFNPPAPCGAGRWHRANRRSRTDFNPPAPCGAGLSDKLFKSSLGGFQSTRPVRGGTIS